MIVIVDEGDYDKAEKYLKDLKALARVSLLQKYGNLGVSALMQATPKDSGLTAASWFFTVEDDGDTSSINFCNSHINQGVPIAIILQYGHGTGTGGYVQGRDYINPAMQPVFDKIVNDLWKEVTSL